MFSLYSRYPNFFVSTKLLVSGFALSLALPAHAQDYPVVQIIKSNASGFAIDGNNGGANGQEVYLYSEDEDNRNQQWYEVNRGNGYYSYQKLGTDFCIDGGNGGAREQSVYLWTCDSNNLNQHWLKVSVDGGYNRLQKRNASGFSIDGKSGGESGQTLHLWTSSDSNQNQQWIFNYVSGDGEILTVDSLVDLRNALENDNQNIVMKSGNYSILDLPSDSRNLIFSGSNNTIDMSGVYIDVPVGSTTFDEAYINIEGSNNLLIGGEFEDTYPNGLTFVTDFVTYNNDRSLSYGLSYAVFVINGENNTVNGLKMTVRSSFPYGYGSTFGIGAGSSFGLRKRSALLINAADNTIDNVEIQHRAFGHGIFMQADADNTTIRNTLVEGRIRETNDMLAEGSGSLPERANYLDSDGNPIPSNEANSLSEDGIRSYNGTGSVLVEGSTVTKMRGGIRLWVAGSAVVRNSTAVDNGNTNFNLPRGAEVTGSTSNFTNGPLHDFAGTRSDQNLDITILPSPNAIGAHDITNILGDNHEIVFRRAGGEEDTDEDRVIRVSGNNSTIRNETEYAIVLASGTSGNTIVSAGPVTDNGSNQVTFIGLEL